MSKEFLYTVTAKGYKGSAIRDVGKQLVSHGQPLVQASWYEPKNDNAKKAWGKKVKAPTDTKDPDDTGGKGGDEQVDAEKLLDCLAGLNHDDDSHWTKDDRPSLTVVNKLYDGDVKVTREDVDALNYPRVKSDAK